MLILIRDEKKFKRTDLLRIIRTLRLKNYSKLNKNDLIEKINRNMAGEYIMKRFLEYINKGKIYINNTDPITQEDIQRPYFELLYGLNRYYRFNMTTFYTYMITTGNFKNPYTDVDFKDEHLMLMDKQMINNKIYKQPLYNIKHNPYYKKIYEENIERYEELVCLDRQIGELLDDVCNDILKGEDPPYYIIKNVFIPNLYILLKHMKRLDVEYTKSSLYDYKDCLKYKDLDEQIKSVITELLVFDI